MIRTLSTTEFKQAQPARYELIIHGLFDHVDDTELFNLFCDYFNEYCEHTAYECADNMHDHFVLLYNLEHAVTTLFDYDNDLWDCFENVRQFELDRIRIIQASQKYFSKRMLANL